MLESPRTSLVGRAEGFGFFDAAVALENSGVRGDALEVFLGDFTDVNQDGLRVGVFAGGAVEYEDLAVALGKACKDQTCHYEAKHEVVD